MFFVKIRQNTLFHNNSDWEVVRIQEYLCAYPSKRIFHYFEKSDFLAKNLIFHIEWWYSKIGVRSGGGASKIFLTHFSLLYYYYEKCSRIWNLSNKLRNTFFCFSKKKKFFLPKSLTKKIL